MYLVVHTFKFFAMKILPFKYYMFADIVVLSARELKCSFFSVYITGNILLPNILNIYLIFRYILLYKTKNFYIRT